MYNLPCIPSEMVIGLECSLRQVICGCGDPVAAHVKFIEAPSRTVWSVLVPRSRMSGGTDGETSQSHQAAHPLI